MMNTPSSRVRRPRRFPRHLCTTAIAVASVISISGCGTHAATMAANSPSGNADTDITVFAAASLKNAFTDIAHTVVPATAPNVHVTLNVAGSSSLVDQIRHGAPADVIATADTANMNKLVTDHLVAQPQGFASNTLSIIVPAGNPGHVTGFNDSLNHADLVVCAPQVPCGSATKKLAKALHVNLHPVSEQNSVSDVRGMVETGQADAGIVYATDAAISKHTETIPIDGAGAVVNAYPIARVASTAHRDAADAFIAAVLSPEGQKILHRYGFGAPENNDRG